MSGNRLVMRLGKPGWPSRLRQDECGQRRRRHWQLVKHRMERRAFKPDDVIIVVRANRKFVEAVMSCPGVRRDMTVYHDSSMGLLARMRVRWRHLPDKRQHGRQEHRSDDAMDSAQDRDYGAGASYFASKSTPALSPAPTLAGVPPPRSA